MLLAQEENGDLSVSELCERLDMSIVNLSHHLVMMSRGRIVRRRTNGKYRHYRLGSTIVRRMLEQLPIVKEGNDENSDISLACNRGVYKVANKTNGMVYVGGAYLQSPKKRLREHRRDLRKGSHPNSKLQKHWECHGEDAFVFEVILKCPRDMVKQEEERWIRRYKKMLGPNKVYNLRNGGSNPSPGILKTLQKRKLPGRG
jgi:DNA-binding transcriptional ArsR family regulator